nr:MAG TPA: hypothetical protein [Caudoviricetes sp.]
MRAANPAYSTQQDIPRASTTISNTPTSLVFRRIPDDTLLVEWCVKMCQRQTIHNLDE